MQGFPLATKVILSKYLTLMLLLTKKPFFFLVLLCTSKRGTKICPVNLKMYSPKGGKCSKMIGVGGRERLVPLATEQY